MTWQPGFVQVTADEQHLLLGLLSSTCLWVLGVELGVVVAVPWRRLETEASHQAHIAAAAFAECLGRLAWHIGFHN